MGTVIMLSGPVGAGKSTVAGELIPLLAPPIAYIEGDTFWNFFVKPQRQDRREHFRVILRSMTAAALPFARSGFTVLLDFSIPPDFLPTAGKILKDITLDYLVLLPGEEVCAARAAGRPAGGIADYGPYQSFYSLFEGTGRHAICEPQASAKRIAKQIAEELGEGRFRVSCKSVLPG